MRLDILVSEKLGVSRTRAQNIIKTGGVKISGNVEDKPSADVSPDAELAVTDTLKYAGLFRRRKDGKRPKSLSRQPR